MTTPGDRVRRLLDLVPYLRAHPGVSLAQVAAEFGVSERQIDKDLWLLFTDCGLPGYMPDDLIDIDFGPDGIWVREDAGLTRPLRLGADEALALTVALRALRAAARGPSPEVDRALDKIVAASADTGADIEIALPAEGSVEESVRAQVDEALRTGRAVRLRHHSQSRDAVTDRVVDPLGLLEQDGHLYLVAWCRTAGDVRRFRTDRIEVATVLSEPSRAPSGVPVPREPFTAHPDHLRVRLLLRPRAAWVVDHYGCTDTVVRPDGDLETTVTVPGEGVVVRLALSVGGDLRVTAPDTVADAVRRAADEALACYPDSVAWT